MNTAIGFLLFIREYSDSIGSQFSYNYNNTLVDGTNTGPLADQKQGAKIQHLFQSFCSYFFLLCAFIIVSKLNFKMIVHSGRTTCTS